ncbi:MAG: TerC family protein [Chloroflexi bacterium]|nr:TerC family protein [Chloroflexota bacterium]
MSTQIIWWIGFGIGILVLLILDMMVFHRRAHVITIKESLLWTAFWIALALLFNLGIYFWQGHGPALEYLTCYLIEKSLSIDNLFVFLMIFSYFAVPAAYQHKVLFWGIIGAIIMRLAFIEAGVRLLDMFHWVFYIFGAFLIVTAFRMAVQKERGIKPERNPVFRLFRRLMPLTDNYEGDRFFVKRFGRYVATPLFIVVVVVETTDIVFALDSIPAAFAITLDPFIVYTSNIFAILGLRALYFALAGIMRLFYYLRHGLVVVLMFVGVKMLIADFYEIPTAIALGVVAGVLLIAILTSIALPRKVEGIPAPPVSAVKEGGLRQPSQKDKE